MSDDEPRPDRGRAVAGATEPPSLPGSATPPAVPAQVGEYFLPATVPLDLIQRDPRLPPHSELVTLLYRPMLLARADMRVVQRKYELETTISLAVLVADIAPGGTLRWEEHRIAPPSADELAHRLPDARFDPLGPPLADRALLRQLRQSFADWARGRGTVTLRANEALGCVARLDESDFDFGVRCQVAAAAKARAEGEALSARYDRKIEIITRRLERGQRALSGEQATYTARQREEAGAAFDTIMDFFRGQRRRSAISSTVGRRRKTERARRTLQEAEAEVAALTQQIAALEAEEATALRALQARWEHVAAERTAIPVQPFKKDVLVPLFGIAWAPYYLLQSGAETLRVPAFQLTPVAP